MLWTKLDADGTLVIQADEPIEAYALKQWEKQRAAGKAALKIETGTRLDLAQITTAIGKDAVAFREWQAKCRTGGMLSEIEAGILLAEKDQP